MVTLAETLERAVAPRPASRPGRASASVPGTARTDSPEGPGQPIGLREPASGQAYDPADHSWGAVEAFLAARAAAGRSSPNTLAAYRNDLRQLRQFLDSREVAGWSVEPVSVLDFVVWLKGQEYAPASMARKLAAVRGFFAHLHESGQLPENPAARVGTPRVGRAAPKTMSEAEIDALLAAPAQRHTPEGARDSAMFALLYATGVRVSELVALDLEDVDLAARTVRCTGRRGRQRVLPFDEDAAGALSAYLTAARPAVVRQGGTRALFVNHRGDRLTRQGFWLVMKSYAASAGVSGPLTPHTMRHSFAAHQLRQGALLREVQQKLGHANISSTQMYRQLPPPGDV